MILLLYNSVPPMPAVALVIGLLFLMLLFLCYTVSPLGRLSGLPWCCDETLILACTAYPNEHQHYNTIHHISRDAQLGLSWDLVR